MKSAISSVQIENSQTPYSTNFTLSNFYTSFIQNSCPINDSSNNCRHLWIHNNLILFFTCYCHLLSSTLSAHCSMLPLSGLLPPELSKFSYPQFHLTQFGSLTQLRKSTRVSRFLLLFVNTIRDSILNTAFQDILLKSPCASFFSSIILISRFHRYK